MFDGPPDHLADLIGDETRWSGLRFIDAYLVCRYAGTEQTVTIRPTGKSYCDRVHHPFRVVCH